jgi:spermidine synthase
MPEPASQRANAGLLAAVGLISVATLAVQVLQTRLFSVMLWHHLTYMVVTVTLLGFAAGGSLLAVWPRLGRLGGDPRIAVSVCCSLFGLTLIAAFALLAHSPLDTLDIEQDRTKYFWLFLRYAWLVVPFVFAGLAIGSALQQFEASVHKTYFWNLLGSGLGGFLFVLLIRPLGGPGCLFLFASLGGLAGLLALHGARSPAARVLGLAALLLWPAALAWPQAREGLVPVHPARSKALATFDGFYREVASALRAQDPAYPPLEAAHRTTRWSPLCRLDTLPFPQQPQHAELDRRDPADAPRKQIHVFQDGDAPTVIWSRGYARSVDYDATFYGLGYRLVRQPAVLIIGPGGGNDVELALHHDARAVTAVEINGDTLAMVRREFGAFTGHVYERPRVTAVHSEGRSFLRRSGGTYDLLQMSGTDTYAALTSGSYIFSESYLYTEEAFDDYFAHLSERGVVSVIRFNFEPPRETLKLVATAARALRKLGVPDPRRHVLVVHQVDRQAQRFAEEVVRQGPPERLERLRGFVDLMIHEPMRYAWLAFARTPFTAADVAAVRAALPALNRNPDVQHSFAWAAAAPDAPAASRPEDGGAGGGTTRGDYARFFDAFAAGPAAEARFYDRYPNDALTPDAKPSLYRYDVRPASDDRPFFFHFHRWGDVWRGLSVASAAGYVALTGSEPIGLYVLAALLIQTLLATLLLVILPLFRLGFRPPPGGSSRARILAYFAALGIAYLLVEITTVQRFVLYLGHPTYALTWGLAAFLVCSGLGSALAGRLGLARRGAALAALAVVALLLAHALWLPAFLHATLDASDAARVALMVAAIAPVAFLMGMPFPTGLKLLGSDARGTIAWAFGVNGAASVLSSIVAIVLAMQAGFSVVFLVAAALYLLAAATVPRAA